MIMIMIKILHQITIGVKMIRTLKRKKVKNKINMTVKQIIMIMINLENKTLIKNMTKEIVKSEMVIEKMAYKKEIVINKKRSLIQIQILDYIM